MSDVAATVPAAVPAKAQKKKVAAKPKVAAAHPQYKVMVAAAITALKERGGSSRQAILKYVTANYKVGDNPTAINARLKAALKAGIQAGQLKQSKGTGAAGSFRLGDKAEKKPKAAKPKSPKKTAAAKPKKAAAAKKPKSPKKTAVKKAAPAAKKPKTPKKAAAAKKPKSPKKAKSPKPAAAKPKAAKPKVAKKPAAAKKPKTPKKAAAAQ